MKAAKHNFISTSLNGVSFTIMEMTAPLNQFIHSIWTSNGVPSIEKERILPDGLSTMIFNFGNPVDIRTGTASYTAPRSFFVGIASTFSDVFYNGSHNQAGITFKPGGAYELLKIPLHEFYNNTVGLDLLAKNKFSIIYEKMQQESTLQGRLIQLHDWLMAKLQNAKPDPKVLSFVAQVGAEDELSIKKIAEKFSMSQQHMGRLLHKYIGANPKMLHRIMRFQKSIHIMQKGRSKNLTDTAYENNYFDQAHFINEFNSFAGVSPRKVSKHILPENPRLLFLDVHFLQF